MHAGARAFGGAALTHGFQAAFYVLAGIAAAGAVLAALMLEARPAQMPETAEAGDALEAPAPA